MGTTDFNIQELMQRDVYVKDTKVGTIVGERHHPNESRVRSMRLQVETDVADEFMRKPAEAAPLPKELVHSIGEDGSVRLSKSMRELQRRWRNTVRINEQLYAPDEMLDRAVLDNQGKDLSSRRWFYLPYDQLSDQLGPLKDVPSQELGIVLVESAEKGRRRRYHKQKLAWILSS